MCAHLLAQLLKRPLLLRMEALHQAAHELVAVLLLAPLPQTQPTSQSWIVTMTAT